MRAFTYFNDAAPFYPHAHPFGVRDWTRDYERPTEAILGETFESRKIYSGKPPSLIPLPVVVGTSACISKGLDPGIVEIGGYSPYCSKVDQPGCYPTTNEEDLKTNVHDCTWAYQAAKILAALGDSLQAGVEAAYSYFGDGATITGHPLVIRVVPPCITVVKGDVCFAFIYGTQTETQWIEQIRNAGWGAHNQGQYGTLPIWQYASNQIAGKLAGDARRYQLVGHSMGGATASILAVNIKQTLATRTVEVMTFGCPLPGDKRLVAKIDALDDQAHYVTVGDPVPHVPPPDYYLAVVLAPGITLVARPPYPFERPNGTILVTRDFKFIPGRNEEYDINILRHIVTALLNGEAPNFDDHMMREYLHRIGMACPCVTVKPEPAPRHTGDGVEAGGGETEIIVHVPASDGVEAGDDDDGGSLYVPGGDGVEAGDSDGEMSLDSLDGDGVEAGDGDDGFSLDSPPDGDGVEAGDGDDGVSLDSHDGDGAEAGDDDDGVSLDPPDDGGDGVEAGDDDGGGSLDGDDDGGGAEAGDDDDGGSVDEDEEVELVTCSGCAETAKFRSVSISGVVGKTAYPQFDDANGTFTLEYSSTYNPGFCSWVYDGGSFSLYLTNIFGTYDLHIDGGASRPSGTGVHYRVTGAECRGSITVAPHSSYATYLDAWPATITIDEA